MSFCSCEGLINTAQQSGLLCLFGWCMIIYAYLGWLVWLSLPLSHWNGNMHEVLISLSGSDWVGTKSRLEVVWNQTPSYFTHKHTALQSVHRMNDKVPAASFHMLELQNCRGTKNITVIVMPEKLNLVISVPPPPPQTFIHSNTPPPSLSI